MMYTKKTCLLRSVGLLFAAAFLAAACHPHGTDEPDSYDKVMILYSAGFNNLSPYLAQNVADLEKGYVPGRKDRNALVVVSRRTLRNSASNYTDETAPCLFRIYSDKGTVVKDTLWSMPVGTTLLDKDVMHRFLTKIRDLFPADSYGMLFSSHTNGWLPAGYYGNPSAFDGRSGARRAAGPIVARIPEIPEGMPLTKSLGPEYYKENGTTYSHELELSDMAGAIPMHLDYLIFDSCLMGGVEVAYELKGVADKIGFSQAEVLAEGLNYRTVAERLLKGTPDPAAVCRDYFDQYDQQGGIYHSATTSMVDCTRLDELAAACKPLFAKYGDAIRLLGPEEVQGFGGVRKPWYFDLRDILEKAGAQESELAALDAALGRCVPYKAHTGQYYSVYAKATGGGTVPVTAFCGLSMYLPGAGSEYLDTYYKTLAWNRAASLVL